MTAAPDPRRLRLTVLFAGVVSLVLVHGPLVGYKVYTNVDEAYAMAIAERLLEGFKLYDGAISQRGPLMYYLFELLAWAHGWDNVVALRLWALALAVAHLVMVDWAGRVFLRPSGAVIATAVTAYLLAFGIPPTDGAALHGETLQLPFLMLAVVAGGVAVRAAPRAPRRRLLLAGAGLALGVAMAIKQSVALHFIPIAVWLVADARRRRQLRPLLADLAVLFGAMAVVPAIFAAVAAAQGTLQQLYYYTVVYNRDVHMRPTAERLRWLPSFFLLLTSQTAFALAVCVLAGRAAPWVLGRLRAALHARSAGPLARGFGSRTYLGMHLVLALATASGMLRFFPHYYLQAAPFLALSLGAMLEPLAERRTYARGARGALTGFVAFTVFASVLGCIFGEKVDGRVGHDRTVQDVSKYINASTRPEQRVFVWGFSPWIYEYAHRRPAGRFVFETYPTGFVPWFWEKLEVERARIVPGSQEALLDDLERERPEIVVDAGSVMLARSIRLYPRFNAWLHASFCFEVRLGPYDVYRRKAEGAECAVPYFPQVAGTQDWNGRGMPIPVPRTLDFDESPHLPIGNYFKPMWFTNGPPPPAVALEAIRDHKREREEAEARVEGFVVRDLEPGSVVLPPIPARPPPKAPVPLP